MKIFNEEIMDEKRKPQIVIVLDQKEARILLEMAEDAVKNHKRKTTWKQFYNKLDQTMGIY